MALNGTELPSWVKAVATLGSTGAIIMIAAYLVYSMVEAQGPSPAIEQALVESRQVMERHSEEADRNADRLRVLLRQICVNTASDAAERRACFQTGPD